MRDKSIINIPVYRTNPRCVDNSLFPPTRSGMIENALSCVKVFNCSIANNIIVENTGKNYKLEVINATASRVSYKKSDLLLFNMTVQKKDFGEEYVETTPTNKIPMSNSVKLGSTTYFFILYPVVVHLKRGSKIQTFWNVFIYDDPNKDSEDFLKVVKNVLKVIMKENIRNIKYKDFLNEIKRFKVLENISASFLTIEDVDENYRARYSEWIAKSSLHKRRFIDFRNMPAEEFQKLFESEDAGNVKISKKKFKISQGFRQYTLKRELKKDAKTLHDRFVNLVESCFNENIPIEVDDKIYEVDYIIKKVGPIIHKYIS